MSQRLFDFYQRKRVVNINVNILASGILAVAIAKLPVSWIGEWIGPERKLTITLAAGAIDIAVDVIIYYGLHWLANHWSPPWQRERNAKPRRSFFKDASLIQFERAILAPLYYAIAMSLMYLLQHQGIRHSWAFVIGFIAGLIVTRILHTVWGLRTGRFAEVPRHIAEKLEAQPPPASAADDSRT